MATKPFKVHKRLLRRVNTAYPCPRISQEWLRTTVQDRVNTHGHQADFNFPMLCQEISDAIEGSSFANITEPGSGLSEWVTRDYTHVLLKGPVVLELVHLTDVGISAMTLEGVRQERERQIYLDRVGHTSNSQEGRMQRELRWVRPELEPYPRRRLKLFLSDGSVELQAIELEHLPNLELGVTPMGTKVHLKDVEIVGGVACLRKKNVMVMGGIVESLQKLHHLRLYEELSRRMDSEESDAGMEGVSPEELYLEHLNIGDL
ncbi:hypothetical protein FA13DRAFT_1804426 [Coprinellus micaceus]|uniref:RecQ-mediated genome instability protein 1 n=1 Tax=Coprinellus micaceus TaxID=71717 RepID=A0A4Y7S7N2_COPMI|nr:hypothetical protein FA13DRAFT_1804426 [Coprinellus micaceus]